jgi:CBS domain-containing protein
MKVFEIMTIDVESVTASDSLSRAAEIMWRRDCGIVPVVDCDLLLGVITDRDIAIAAATRNLNPSEITAGSMIGRPVRTCRMEDTVGSVVRLMRRHRIRRIPVVGERGELLGILSVADLLSASKRKRPPARRLFRLLRSLAEPHRPEGAVND